LAAADTVAEDMAAADMVALDRTALDRMPSDPRLMPDRPPVVEAGAAGIAVPDHLRHTQWNRME
jgi:hypothetical protein